MREAAAMGVQIVNIDDLSPTKRGEQRGQLLDEKIHVAVERYLHLFDALGVPADHARAAGEAALESIAMWAPWQVDELSGLARAAEFELWQVAMLNARTEVLSMTPNTAHECSSLATTAGRPIGVQTWDWHLELADLWHLQTVVGTPHAFVGLTEAGILAKVGINDAGVGVLLNILGHRSDGIAGVPVHLVLQRVLAEAGDLDEAVEMLRSAPVAASSAVTVVAPQGIAIVELCPAGSAVLPLSGGCAIHTNHFVDERLAVDAITSDDDASVPRYTALADATTRGVRGGLERLYEIYTSRTSRIAPLCCAPLPDAAFGTRWATLATIAIEADERRMTVSSGSPLDRPHAPTATLVAGRAR